MSRIDPPATGLKMLFDLALDEGGQLVADTLQLPPKVGRGFITMLEPEPGWKLAIHNCTLAREVVLRRLAVNSSPETLLISFSSFALSPEVAARYLSSIQITSSDIGFTTTLPAHTALFIVGVSLQKTLLLKWLNLEQENAPAILAARYPLVLDTLMTPAIQRVLFQLAGPRSKSTLDSFFLKIKTQELLYLLFLELEGRTAFPLRHLHQDDVEKIYQVRESLLATLGTPPVLANLARAAGLSQTKMKALFRQVFGTSIYSYFQNARMEEAKRRLSHLSVSEVGASIGFTNLSHFARLFEKHHGLTPKKYQAKFER